MIWRFGRREALTMLKKHKQFASTDVPVGAVADNTVDPDAISPETGKPFSKLTVFRFLAAFVIYAVLNNAAFTINGSNLLPQHLKDVGMANPTAAFGIITSVTSLVSLFAGYIWGTMSDRTRSRFGKRTPWIFWGVNRCRNWSLSLRVVSDNAQFDLGLLL